MGCVFGLNCKDVNNRLQIVQMTGDSSGIGVVISFLLIAGEFYRFHFSQCV